MWKYLNSYRIVIMSYLMLVAKHTRFLNHSPCHFCYFIVHFPYNLLVAHLYSHWYFQNTSIDLQCFIKWELPWLRNGVVSRCHLDWFVLRVLLLFKQVVTEHERAHSSLRFKSLAGTTHISFFSKAIFLRWHFQQKTWAFEWNKPLPFSAMITIKLNAHPVIENNSL